MPLYQLVVLRDIGENPNSMVQEISQRLNLAQSMVSKVIASAKQQGLIATQADTSDRRKVRIALSQRVIEQLHPRLTVSVEEALKPLLGELSKADKDCILRSFVLLHKLFKAKESDRSQ